MPRRSVRRLPKCMDILGPHPSASRPWEAAEKPSNWRFCLGLGRAGLRLQPGDMGLAERSPRDALCLPLLRIFGRRLAHRTGLRTHWWAISSGPLVGVPLFQTGPPTNRGIAGAGIPSALVQPAECGVLGHDRFCLMAGARASVLATSRGRRSRTPGEASRAGKHGTKSK